jgi:hypothetical protein
VKEEDLAQGARGEKKIYHEPHEQQKQLRGIYEVVPEK